MTQRDVAWTGDAAVSVSRARARARTSRTRSDENGYRVVSMKKYRQRAEAEASPSFAFFLLERIIALQAYGLTVLGASYRFDRTVAILFPGSETRKGWIKIRPIGHRFNLRESTTFNEPAYLAYS